MHEPATTLTDFILAIECAWFALLLARRDRFDAGLLRTAFVALFGSAAVAALAGGTVHGFFPDAAGLGNRALWLVTLWSLGLTAAAMLALSLRLLTTLPDARILLAALAAWIGYAALVLFLWRDFAVAIGAYLPAALLLLGALWRRHSAQASAGARAGLLGITLALAGALTQQAGIGLHPVHFDHNAVYHVVQMVALYLLYRCAVLLRAPTPSDVASEPELTGIG